MRPLPTVYDRSYDDARVFGSAYPVQGARKGATMIRELVEAYEYATRQAEYYHNIYAMTGYGDGQVAQREYSYGCYTAYNAMQEKLRDVIVKAVSEAYAVS